MEEEENIKYKNETDAAAKARVTPVYIDATQYGPQTYRELRRANSGINVKEGSAADYFIKQRQAEEDAIGYGGTTSDFMSAYNGTSDRYQSSLAQQGSYLGESMWDANVEDFSLETLTEDPNALNDYRALNQSIFAQIGAGLAKTAIKIGATWANSLAGSLVGIFEASYNTITKDAEEGQSKVDQWINSFTHSFIFRNTAKFEEWAGEYFKNYKTSEEQNMPWYKRMITPSYMVNFLMEDFLVNLGFSYGTVASMATGGAILRALGAGVKGVTWATNVMGLLSAASEATVETTEAQESILRLYEDRLKNQNAAIRASWDSQLATEYERELANLDYEVANSAGGPTILDNGQTVDSRDLYRQKRLAEIDEKYSAIAEENRKRAKTLDTIYEEGMRNAQSASKDVAKYVFLANIAVLSMSNLGQYTKLLTGSSMQAEKAAFKTSVTDAKERAIRQVKENAAKQLRGNRLNFKARDQIKKETEAQIDVINKRFERLDKSGTGLRRQYRIENGLAFKKNPRWEKAKAFIFHPASEAAEEFAQSLASHGSQGIAEAELDEFINSGYDPEYRYGAVGGIASFLSKAAKSAVTADWGEDVFLGALMGAFMPIRMRRRDGSSTLAISSYAEYYQAKSQSEALDSHLAVLNERLGSKNFQERVKMLARQFENNKKMQDALIDDDAYTYNNYKYKDFYADIVSFDAVGQLGLLKSFVENTLGSSDENMQTIIKENTTPNAEGKNSGVFYDANGNFIGDAAAKEIVDKRREKSLKAIDDYLKFYNEAQQETSGGSSEFLREIAWLKLNITNREERAQQLNEENKEVFDKISNEIDNLKSQYTSRLSELDNSTTTIESHKTNYGNTVKEVKDQRNIVENEIEEKQVAAYEAGEKYKTAHSMALSAQKEGKQAEALFYERIASSAKESQEILNANITELKQTRASIDGVLAKQEAYKTATTDEELTSAIRDFITSAQSLLQGYKESFFREGNQSFSIHDKSFLVNIAKERGVISEEEGKTFLKKASDSFKLAKSKSDLETLVERYKNNPAESEARRLQAEQSMQQYFEDEEARIFNSEAENITTVKGFREYLATVPEDVRGNILEKIKGLSEKNDAAGEYYSIEGIAAILKDTVNKRMYDEQLKQDIGAIVDYMREHADSIADMLSAESSAIPGEGFFFNPKDINNNYETRYREAIIVINELQDILAAQEAYANAFSNVVEVQNGSVENAPTGTTGASGVSSGVEATLTLSDTSKGSDGAPYSKRESQLLNRITNQTLLPEISGSKSNGIKKFWIPAIHQYNLNKLKKGEFEKNDVATKQLDPFRDYSDIYSVLESSGAFDFVNSGNLKAGETIQFMIDPEFEAQHAGKAWHTEPVVWITNSKGQILNVLQSSQTASNYAGLTAIRAKVVEEYYKSPKSKAVVQTGENLTPAERVAEAQKLLRGQSSQESTSKPEILEDPARFSALLTRIASENNLNNSNYSIESKTQDLSDIEEILNYKDRNLNEVAEKRLNKAAEILRNQVKQSLPNVPLYSEYDDEKHIYEEGDTEYNPDIYEGVWLVSKVLGEKDGKAKVKLIKGSKPLNSAVSPKFFSTITTRVNQVMPGRLRYGDKEVSLNELFSGSHTNDPKNIVIIDHDGKFHINNGIKKDQIEGFEHLDGLKSKVFLLVKNGSGTYSPVSIRVSHFNEKEWLSNPNNLETVTGKAIQEIISKIATISTEGRSTEKVRDELEKYVEELKQYLYIDKTTDIEYTNNGIAGPAITIRTIYRDAYGNTKTARNKKGYRKLREVRKTIYLFDKSGETYEVKTVNSKGTPIVIQYSVKEMRKKAAAGDPYFIDLLTKYEATRTPTPDTEKINNLLEAIKELNFPLNIDKQALSGNNNRVEELIASNVFHTDLTSLDAVNTWFTMDYYDDKGNQVTAEEIKSLPYSTAEYKYNNTSRMPATIQVKEGNSSYYVDLTKNIPVIYDSMGEEVTNISEEARTTIIYVATGNAKFKGAKEGINLYNGIWLTGNDPDSVVVDLNNGVILTGQRAEDERKKISNYTAATASKKNHADAALAKLQEDSKNTGTDTGDPHNFTNYTFVDENGVTQEYQRTHAFIEDENHYGPAWDNTERRNKIIKDIYDAIVNGGKIPNKDLYVTITSKEWKELEEKVKNAKDATDAQRKINDFYDSHIEPANTYNNTIGGSILDEVSRSIIDGFTNLKCKNAESYCDSLLPENPDEKDASALWRDKNPELAKKISYAAYKNIVRRYRDLFIELEREGSMIYASNLRIHHEFENGTKVAGELDALIKKQDGTFVIWDFKTSLKNFFRDGKAPAKIKEVKDSDTRLWESTAITPKNPNKRRQGMTSYQLQLNIYAAILRAHYGIEVTGMKLIPFDIKTNTVESENRRYLQSVSEDTVNIAITPLADIKDIPSQYLNPAFYSQHQPLQPVPQAPQNLPSSFNTSIRFYSSDTYENYAKNLIGKLEVVLGKLEREEQLTQDDWITVRDSWVFDIFPALEEAKGEINKILARRNAVFQNAHITLYGDPSSFKITVNKTTLGEAVANWNGVIKAHNANAANSDIISGIIRPAVYVSGIGYVTPAIVNTVATNQQPQNLPPQPEPAAHPEDTLDENDDQSEGIDSETCQTIKNSQEAIYNSLGDYKTKLYKNASALGVPKEIYEVPNSTGGSAADQKNALFEAKMRTIAYLNSQLYIESFYENGIWNEGKLLDAFKKINTIVNNVFAPKTARLSVLQSLNKILEVSSFIYHMENAQEIESFPCKETLEKLKESIVTKVKFIFREKAVVNELIAKINDNKNIDSEDKEYFSQLLEDLSENVDTLEYGNSLFTGMVLLKQAALPSTTIELRNRLEIEQDEDTGEFYADIASSYSEFISPINGYINIVNFGYSIESVNDTAGALESLPLGVGKVVGEELREVQVTAEDGSKHKNIEKVVKVICSSATKKMIEEGGTIERALAFEEAMNSSQPKAQAAVTSQAAPVSPVVQTVQSAPATSTSPAQSAQSSQAVQSSQPTTTPAQGNNPFSNNVFAAVGLGVVPGMGNNNASTASPNASNTPYKPREKNPSNDSTAPISRAEKRWFKKNFPELSDAQIVQVVESIKEAAKYGKEAWGMYKDGIITLTSDAVEGTLYHEAFHAILDLITSTEDRNALFAEARQIWGAPFRDAIAKEVRNKYYDQGLSEGEIQEKINAAIELALEEKMAYAFQEFALIMQGQDEDVTGETLEFFNKVLANSKALAGGLNAPILHRFFMQVYSGTYSSENRDILKNAPRDSEGRLLAPNGKPSNLTTKQYVQVRTKAFKDWFGDWEALTTFNTKGVDTNKVDIEEVTKPWKNNPNKSNKTLRIYLKNQHEKGYFELVKDEEFGYYSVHFKTTNEKSEGTTNASPSTKAERTVLYEQLINAIPEGARVSTWGSLSNGGFIALNKVGKSMTKVGEREVTRKSDGSKTTIPIFRKGEENVSKVVDENGEPLVVYHHTDNEDLNEFSTDFDNYFSQHKGGTKKAIFFTGTKTPKSGTVMQRKATKSVFLNIRDVVIKQGTKNELEASGEGFIATINNSSVNHDGVIFHGMDDNQETNQDIYVIHDPNNVKSATDNNGDFSTENNDIRFREKTQEWREAKAELVNIQRTFKAQPDYVREELKKMGFTEETFDMESEEFREYILRCRAF